jgi:hypothetical protein
MLGKYGAGRLSQRLGSQYLSAIYVLIGALNAAEALDDFLQVIDRNPETGNSVVEDGDVPIGGTGGMGGSGGNFGGGGSGGNF